MRMAVEKIRHGATGFYRDGVGAFAGGKCSVSIGVGLLQIVADGINDPLRNLRSSGTVQKDRRLAIQRLRKAGNCGANPGDVQFGSDFVLLSST